MLRIRSIPSVGLSLALSGMKRPPVVDTAASLTFTRMLFDNGLSSPVMKFPSSLFARNRSFEAEANLVGILNPSADEIRSNVEMMAIMVQKN
jgi:hypothetical protein